ncbi:hypothetical protein IF2G_10568 [Cordyceps javanica]|nr:hypothetical protein IF2G_10568 [Cordyceps javanica]
MAVAVRTLLDQCASSIAGMLVGISAMREFNTNGLHRYTIQIQRRRTYHHIHVKLMAATKPKRAAMHTAGNALAALAHRSNTLPAIFSM